MTAAVASPSTPTGLEPYRFSQGDLARLVENGILDGGCELAEGVAMAGDEPCLFSVEQYHRMGEAGILTSKDRIVLLEGRLVRKMTIHPPHAYGVMRCFKLLFLLVDPSVWTVRSQQPITLGASEPEPDGSVARGTDADYSAGRHPVASQLGMVVEVADSTLRIDRTVSARIYGGAGIPVYWIINLIDRQVEVMTQPTAAGYAQRTDHLPGQAVPVVLDGVHVGDLLVDDLLP